MEDLGFQLGMGVGKGSWSWREFQWDHSLPGALSKSVTVPDYILRSLIHVSVVQEFVFKTFKFNTKCSLLKKIS